MKGNDVEVTIRGIQARLRADELAVMRLLAQGYRYREMTGILCITEYAIQKRVLSVCSALGARNRTEALVLLLQEGILQ